LGRKAEPNPISEYSFYTFRGGHELLDERPGTVTFQHWLDVRFGSGTFVVIDFPTVDTEKVDPSQLSCICDCIGTLLSAGASVVVVDSGGFGRTGKVCATLGAKAISVGR
jgi:hypothetical protein